MTQKPIPITEIAKIADDIRLIKDFSENNNFDASLINATIQPRVDKKPWDWPLICASLFSLFLIFIIALMKFWKELSEAGVSFLFILGLLFGGVATISLHKRFEDLTITITSGIVLSLILLIGSGVLTPKEVIDEAKQLHKDKNKD